MAVVAGRYAVRSVSRNLRRTVLSILGIAIGCVLALTMESLNRGKQEIFARVGASGGVGHVRVMPAGWRERRDPRLRLADPDGTFGAARSLRDVALIAPRVRAEVLLAMGSHVVAAEMTGVDPGVEPQVFRYVRTIASGRYLRPGDAGAVVIGRAIADRLSADVDDDLVGTAVGPRGEVESAMFHIVGIAATGSDDADQTICHTLLADVETLSGRPGIGELALVLHDYRRVSDVKRSLAAHISPSNEVLEFGEIVPELEGHLQQDAASSRFIGFVILLIVVLGVASAQLAAVLERRREFAVLSALGMSGATMVRLVLQEALLLGLAGAVLGVAAGAPLMWEFARHGLDFSGYLGDSYSFGGVLIDPVIYGDFGVWMVGYVLVVAVGATLVASVYPAWYAARTDPAVALRVSQ